MTNIIRRCGDTENKIKYYPSDFENKDAFARCSLRMKENTGAAFCSLPFCNTVEAEALGAIVHFENEDETPRIREPLCKTLDQILQLPKIDYEEGRIREILCACKILDEKKECVMYELSGPLTILNGLTDLSIVLKAIRKKQEEMKRLYEKLEDELVRFVDHLICCNVQMISYADPIATKEILGQKMVKQIHTEFTVPFLKKIKGDCTIVLCPKMAGDLIDAGLCHIEEIKFTEKLSYGEACRKMAGCSQIISFMCIHNEQKILEDQTIMRIRLI